MDVLTSEIRDCKVFAVMAETSHIDQISLIIRYSMYTKFLISKSVLSTSLKFVVKQGQNLLKK